MASASLNADSNVEGSEAGGQKDVGQGPRGYTATPDNRICRCVLAHDEAGIAVSDILAWNAYPWHINRFATSSGAEAGVEPPQRLWVLLPELRVVMLDGGSARDGWTRLTHA